LVFDTVALALHQLGSCPDKGFLAVS